MLGGDGLVAARHLYLFGFVPTVYYPKKTKRDLFQRLEQQLLNLKVAVTTNTDELDQLFMTTNHVVDALFGFSFKPPVRDPFGKVIELMIKNPGQVPITSVDIPSSWNVDSGPEDSKFQPTTLISLTAPKPAAMYFKGRHFVGGRFISKEFAEKYGVNLPSYPGCEQIVEVTN